MRLPRVFLCSPDVTYSIRLHAERAVRHLDVRHRAFDGGAVLHADEDRNRGDVERAVRPASATDVGTGSWGGASELASRWYLRSAAVWARRARPPLGWPTSTSCVRSCEASSWVVAAYAGYSNGDFFELRRRPVGRTRFGNLAPQRAVHPLAAIEGGGKGTCPDGT